MLDDPEFPADGALNRFSRSVGLAALLLFAMSGCVTPHNPLAHWVPSPNHNARAAILVVLHATEQDSVQQSLQTLRTGNSGGPGQKRRRGDKEKEPLTICGWIGCYWSAAKAGREERQCSVSSGRESPASLWD